MIQIQVQKSRNNTLLIEASGWGKSLQRQQVKFDDVDRAKHALCKSLILDKLKGFVQSRQIAYKAKHYVDDYKLNNIHNLLYHLEYLPKRSAFETYVFVKNHELKIRSILPTERNASTTSIEEIIRFCKNQLKPE